jgi:hypothetical protein
LTILKERIDLIDIRIEGLGFGLILKIDYSCLISRDSKAAKCRPMRGPRTARDMTALRLC